LLTVDTWIKRSSAVLEAEVGDEVVALHAEKGFCYGLNKIGSRIWRLTAAPVRVGDICSHLQQEYDVQASVCQADVLELLEGLQAEGLIDLVPGEIALL